MSLLKVKNYSVLCLDIDLNYWNILSLVMSSNNLNTTAFQSCFKIIRRMLFT